jgi:CTP:molybdopterin cytidylyltransferase MocA
MVNAVILAGGKGKDYHHNSTYEKKYGTIIPGERKAVMRYKDRPMIIPIIDALRNSKSIENMVVVGNKELLERNNVNGVEIMDQGESMIENALKGYNYFCKKGETLFVPCDIPEITYGIDEFIENAEGDFCLAVTNQKYLKQYDSLVHRPYCWLKNEDGNREGYRISNIVLANPEFIDNHKMIQMAFDLRKALTHFNIFKIFNSLGWDFPFKYFIKKNLSLKDVEERFSEKFGCEFKIGETSDPGASLDIDFKRDHRRMDKFTNPFKT